LVLVPLGILVAIGLVLVISVSLLGHDRTTEFSPAPGVSQRSSDRTVFVPLTPDETLPTPPSPPTSLSVHYDPTARLETPYRVALLGPPIVSATLSGVRDDALAADLFAKGFVDMGAVMAGDGGLDSIAIAPASIMDGATEAGELVDWFSMHEGTLGPMAVAEPPVTIVTPIGAGTKLRLEDSNRSYEYAFVVLDDMVVLIALEGPMPRPGRMDQIVASLSLG